MGIVFMVMIMVVIVRTIVVFAVGHDVDAGRTVDDGFRIGQDIIHKFLQTGTGEDHGFSRLDGLHLVDAQGVVMQTGNFVGDQLGYGQIGAVAQLPGELINRTGGGHDVTVSSWPGTAGQQNEQCGQNKDINVLFHK